VGAGAAEGAGSDVSATAAAAMRAVVAAAAVRRIT